MTIYGIFFNGYSGVSRLGDSMSVLADNVANLNTIGFKGSRSIFEEILNTATEPARQGNGVGLAMIDTDFNLGKFEVTKVPTDMAIDGKGFFVLSDGAGGTFYTRNGQFRLQENAASQQVLDLVSASGLAVQGYGLDANNAVDATSVTSLSLARRSQPKTTEAVRLIVNIESSAELSDVPLYARWDGSRTADDGSPAPISEDDYNYAATFPVYDEDGEARTITVYFDDTTDPGVKEFLVACDPGKDRRLYDAATGARYNDSGQPTMPGAGALLYGRLRFNSQGDLIDIAAYQVPANGDVAPDTATNRIQLGRGEAYYSFAYNFTGTGEDRAATLDFGTRAVPQAVNATGRALVSAPGKPPAYVSSASRWEEVYDENGRQPAAGDVITFTGTRGDGTAVTLDYTVNLASELSDLLANLEQEFACVATVEEGVLTLTDTTVGDSALAITSITYRNAAGETAATNADIAQIFAPNGSRFETSEQARFQIAPITSTSYATASHTLLKQQDGYGSGYLEGFSVDADGLVYGHYSNGRKVVQGQLVLATVANVNGLERQGGTLFLYRDEAGALTTGVPNAGGFGAIRGGALEGANVDLGRQFADLIITQRAYQANAKSIQTADAVYETLVRMGSR